MPTISNPDDGPNDLPDEVVEALRDERRQAIVTTLRDHEGVLTLVILASKLAADTDASRRDMVIELHDTHVPELEECGLIDYDEDTGEVALGLPADTVTTALAHAQNTDN